MLRSREVVVILVPDNLQTRKENILHIQINRMSICQWSPKLSVLKEIFTFKPVSVRLIFRWSFLALLISREAFDLSILSRPLSIQCILFLSPFYLIGYRLLGKR